MYVYIQNIDVFPLFSSKSFSPSSSPFQEKKRAAQALKDAFWDLLKTKGIDKGSNWRLIKSSTLLQDEAAYKAIRDPAEREALFNQYLDKLALEEKEGNAGDVSESTELKGDDKAIIAGGNDEAERKRLVERKLR